MIPILKGYMASKGQPRDLNPGVLPGREQSIQRAFFRWQRVLRKGVRLMIRAGCGKPRDEQKGPADSRRTVGSKLLGEGAIGEHPRPPFRLDLTSASHSAEWINR